MSFVRDLKIAIRSLSRVPALWITVALTLALGIGANAAIFSVVRAVLLRPLANRDEDRLLYIRQSAPGIGQTNAGFSIPEIMDLGTGLKSISELGTFSEIGFTVIGLGTPREIPAGVVDGHYFDVMGLKPVLGRLLGPSDDGPNAAGAIVLTYNFWRDQLHSDPTVIGKVVRLEGSSGARSATVVGVLEPSVPYPVATEIIANVVTSPHHLSATMVQGRSHRMTEVFARLAPNATLDQARAELDTSYSSMTRAQSETYKPTDRWAVTVTRMHEQINAKANTILWLLFAASALLFIIASSNVANLVLARTVRRESELAVRAALGANRAVLRRSLLAESLVLCVTGVAAAILLAAPVFLAYIPRLPSPTATQGGLNVRGTRVAGSARRLRTFAVTQIAASFLLLVGACVLMRTLYVLEQTRPPFDSGQVLSINIPTKSYGNIRDRVSQIPGVDKVAGGFSTPWRGERENNISFSFAANGAHRPDGQDWRANFRSVSPDYFATLGMPILAGRDFNPSDRENTEKVVIISQSLANALFPGQNAVNRYMHWTDPVMKFIDISYDPRRIIAVVPDIDDENIVPAPSMTIYQDTDQEGWNDRLFVRVHGDPYLLVPAITQAIHKMSSDEPVEKATTLGDLRAEVLAPDRLNAIVFGGFAAVALLISIVGVAGVLAFSVSSRTREFGIRIAMGAMPRNILSSVLAEGFVMACIGVGAGLVVGFAVARIVSRYVSVLDQPGLIAFSGSAAIILTAAVVACAVPAVRASIVNAMEALRTE